MATRPRVISARDTRILREAARRAPEGEEAPSEDSYVTKLIKYIPAEIVAAYLTLSGIIATAETVPQVPTLWVVAGSLLVFTFLWVLFGTRDRSLGLPPPYYQAIVSSIAFAVWVMVISGDTLLEHCWLPLYGSLLLIGVTLLIPLFEKIFVRTGAARG